MLSVLAVPVGGYQINTVVVWDEATKDAVWFDPGAEAERIIAQIRKRGLTIQAIVNTHGHLDHIAENSVAKAQLGVPLLIHSADRHMLTSAADNLSSLTGHDILSPDADRTLAEGETLTVGRETMQIFHVPGHTPGSLVFYHAGTPGFVVAGDTLFRGSVGRSDFPGGSEDDLLQNIRAKILTLPDDTVIYPGHGPTTTVGEERRTNPFLQ
jgi:hydroxyacylglutathione hydrolase